MSTFPTLMYASNTFGPFGPGTVATVESACPIAAEIRGAPLGYHWYIVSAGVDVDPAGQPGDQIVTRSHPDSGGAYGFGWTVSVYNASAAPRSFTVSIACAAAGALGFNLTSTGTVLSVTP